MFLRPDYLADTSIWIDYLNNNTSETIDELIALEHTGLMPLIYTEILQGARNKKMVATYKYYLQAQTFYTLKDNWESYENAALIYGNCRKKGITIRSSIDCLIAQCAIENEVILLHNDKDFVQMSGVIPALKQQYIGD